MNERQNKVDRRQFIQGAVSAGVGLMASPFAVANDPGSRMVARMFFDSATALALRAALRYAGDYGFVASLPQLLHARTNAPYDNIIWNTWFTTNSEESVVKTPQGNHVVVAVHGGGIFGNPEKIERTLRADMNRLNDEGLTGQYAAKITDQDARDLLQGRLQGGAEFPVYGFDEFKQGVANLPVRYGVVLDFETARKADSGFVNFDILRDQPNMIIRAGGTAPLAAYLDKAKQRNNTEKMGSVHRHNNIDPDQPQTRILKLGGSKGGKGSDGREEGVSRGYDADWGISAGGLVDFARFVAVAPRNVSTDLQYLDFEL